jgi:hypothetical protein
MLARVSCSTLIILGSLPGPLALSAQVLERPGFVSVWSDRERPYSRGDEARIYLRTDRPAHLTVLRVDTDGRVRMLFPREPWGRTRIAGDRTFEVTRPPDGTAFRVDDYPGIGYLLAIASSSPFDYDDITRGDHWDYRAIADGRVRGDPYVVLASFAAGIAKGSYQYDIAPYYVERHYQYPRFACYDCHSYASYEDWDPYGAACTRFRVVIYDDPSYYPYRYNQGRNVVVARPVHPAPRFVFEDTRPGLEYVTHMRGPASRPHPLEIDRGRTSADVGGQGAVPAPGLTETRREPNSGNPRNDAWQRRPTPPSDESTQARRRGDRPAGRDQAPEGIRPSPQSTGEPELRRRRPEHR